MEMSRRFRGTRKVNAALSDEVKEQIRQKVYELINTPTDSSTAQPTVDGGQIPTEVSDQPEGFADGGEAESQLSLEQGPVPTEQTEGATSEGGAIEAQPAEDDGAVDMPMGDDSMSNADEAAQENLSPTAEMNFDDDGTGAFDAGDGADFDFGDLSIGGEADDEEEEFPELLPPKSRREQSTESSTTPAPAEPAATPDSTETTSNSFGETIPVEKSEPSSDSGAEVKNPTKNTKVPTLSGDKEASTRISMVARRGRFDKIFLWASRGNQTKRKNKDSMPDKDTKFTPRRDPEVRAPKKVKRDTVETSKAQDKDIGRDPDMRKD